MAKNDSSADVPRKTLKLSLIVKEPEHIEPARHALEKFALLREWMNLPSNKHLLTSDSVLMTRQFFHPDWKYNQTTRELRIDALPHMSKLWERWENLSFDPNDPVYAPFVKIGVALGLYSWLINVKDDYLKLGMTVSAQLAYYEGDLLVGELKKTPPDLAAVWRRLYWFTRFHAAWWRIGSKVAPDVWDDKREGLTRIHEWRRDSWTYLLERRAKKSSVTDRQVAIDFAKIYTKNTGHKLASPTVQEYYTYCKKNSVGRPTADKSK